MPTQNFFLYAINIFWQLFRDLALLPVWWYTKGALKCAIWCAQFIADWWKALALGVWIKYLFVPMYGQRDIPGRLISFIMRLFQIIARSLAFFFWVSMGIIMMILYLALPLIIITQIIIQIKGLYA
jgi:hypothetical protein